jgi:hypothetical protein
VTHGAPAGDDRARFRRTQGRVMLMQVIALLLLAWLQIAFTP